jgi:dTMP kinase
MAERRGLLITFEGIDGSGKSTHLRLLAEWMKSQGIIPQTYAEPGGTALGRKLREILLNGGDPIDIRTEALLFLAARSELVATVLLPELEASTIILLDRFTDSTLAYQGWGRGIDIAELTRLAYFAAHSLEADLTFFLDIPPQQAIKRCRRPHRAADRFESAGLEYFNRVREGYLALAQTHQDRIIVLDSSLSMEAVSKKIVDVTQTRLKISGHMLE